MKAEEMLDSFWLFASLSARQLAPFCAAEESKLSLFLLHVLPVDVSTAGVVSPAVVFLLPDVPGEPCRQGWGVLGPLWEPSALAREPRFLLPGTG